MVSIKLFPQGVNCIKPHKPISVDKIKNGLRYTPKASDTVTFKGRKMTSKELADWKQVVAEAQNNSFSGFETTNNMTSYEVSEFKKSLVKYNDVEAFILVSTGGRPAMSTQMHPSINKIKSDKFDILKWDDQVFIFNKEAMLENIKNNKYFYNKRLNLPENSTYEQIYKTITSSDSPLLNIKDSQDLIGVMFGYPFKNTIVFQLERDSGMYKNIVKCRKNIPQYKDTLKKALYAEDSKYSSFGEEFKRDMEKSIDSIISVKNSGSENYPMGYTFMHSISEPLEEHRINKCIRESADKVQKINNIEKEKEQSRLQIMDYMEELVQRYGHIYMD